MRLMDLFKIADGNLSICGIMIGDNFDEQHNKLIEDGTTSEKWDLSKGTILTNPQSSVYTKYLKYSTISLEGKNINCILFQAEFTSYPNEVADAFLGIILKMEEYGLPIIKPKWQVFDDMITNQYRIHNSLWDVEVNEKIIGKGETIISLELSANLIDKNGEIAEDALGVYKSINSLARREWQHEEYIRKKDCIIFD